MDLEMNENKQSAYVAFEYRSVNVMKDFEHIYIDCYKNLGWQIMNAPEGNNLYKQGNTLIVNLNLKRERKIKNRSTLISLQKKCENALRKIEKLEKSKETMAMIVSFTMGVLGLGFITEAIVSFKADHINLAIALILAGCICFIFPLPIYKKIRVKQENKVASLIEEQYDLIYDLCEQARRLIINNQ